MQRSWGRFIVGLGLVLGLVCSGGVAQADTLNVPDDYATIQSAIDAALPGDTVLVDDGTYTENIDFNGKAITVRSVNGAEDTIIDGNAGGSVVTFASGEGIDSIIDGFTITNGTGTVGTHPQEGNKTVGGGILCWDNTSPTITNCIIKNNTVQIYGAGIYGRFSSSPTIENCTIISNTSGSGGGGIMCWGDFYSITNCTISGNTANNAGGGIYTRGSSSITNCIISGNIANTSGGIHCDNATPTITNCTISGNIANDTGGAMRCWLSSLTVVNSILWGNMAGVSGNEIYLHNSSIDITYSVVSG